MKNIRLGRIVTALSAAGALILSSCFGPKASKFACPESQRASLEAAAAPLPPFRRVFIVVLENKDAEDALARPFMRKLASTGALLSNFHAITHPSQPNYIALTAGSTLGVDSNDTADLSLPDKHLGDLLDERGRSWKLYAEDYPGNCFLGDTSGAYARKHVPFLNFRNVQEDATRCSKVVNAAELEQDVANGDLPDFALYIPNNINNGHDTDAGYSDQWLQSRFEPLLKDPVFAQGTLFVVTFDESGSHADAANRIYTTLNGAGVKAGSATEACYTHYDLLRTIEELLGLDTLGKRDASGMPVTGIWEN